ncbi:hypothetical protein ACOMHN_023275 [Nucella lapillus]
MGEHLAGFVIGFFAVTSLSRALPTGSGCGGSYVIKHQPFTFSSPNYGVTSYPDNIECRWSFTSANNKTFKLTFVDMDLQFHERCLCDYMVICHGACGHHTSGSSSSPSRHCGSVLPDPVTSKESELCVVFHSDGMVTGNGFNATVELVGNTSSDACSESSLPSNMAATTGEITSPGFSSGESYPNNAHCQWIIQVPYGMMIQLMFTAFDVEFHPICSYDKLKIWEKQPEAGTLLRELCGTSLPGNVSSYENLVIDFRSDHIGRRSGFRAVYQMIYSERPTPDPCLEGRGQCGSGLCIPNQWFCDGELDCPAGDDEQNCDLCQSGEFQCLNDSCVPQDNVCDGLAHCSDAEDEADCVRVSREGLLQINKEGQWIPVCNSSWTPELGHGACAAAGLGTMRNTGTTEVTSETYVTWTQEDADTYLQARGAANVGSSCPSNMAVTLNCSQQECGQRLSSLPQPYVLGSQESVTGQWPWMVAIMTGDLFRCGGSLIADRWVLTAGHCIDNLVHLPERLTIVSGHVNNDVSRLGQETRVTEVVLHPENDYIYNSDIALLRLQTPVTLSADVRPVCLPGRVHRQWSDRLPCYVSGWGVTDIANRSSSSLKDLHSQKISSILHHAKVKLWTQEKCQAVYPSRLIPSMICAGYEQGEIDACKGDSGGPLVCRTSNASWTQVGVVSWGEGCGTKGKPGVYTRVDSFLRWIQHLTAEDDVTASCNFETPFICGYTSDVNATSSLLWSRRSGGLALPARPVVDHTYDNVSGHYMYTHIASENRQESTALYTSPLHVQSEACVTFHVIFFGNTDATLTVNAIGLTTNQSQQLLLLKNAGGDWSAVETELAVWVEQVSFVVHTNFKTDGGIGVDDVTVTYSRCPEAAKLSCDFNGGMLCQYRNSASGNSQWLLVPKTQNSSSDHYIEADLRGSYFGDTTQLISPNMTSSIERCLRFRYLISPALSVTLSACTLSHFGERLFLECSRWQRSSSVGDHWTEGQASVPASASLYEVVFQAKRGFRGGVVRLDDIRKIDGPCP